MEVDWDAYRVFLALHRAGSIVKAARQLRVDMSTVRRRLATLEEALGAALVQRRRQGVVLTRAGERLLGQALRLEATALEIERQVGDGDRKAEGSVRISAGEAFIARVIAPAAARLRARHPGIRLELAVDNQRVDLVRGDADVALRLMRPTDQSLVGRRVGTLDFGLYASPKYLARAGRPRHEGELSQHMFVGYDASLERTPETQWLLARGAEFVVRANAPLPLYAATAAGAGIAAIATLFARGEPGLERILPSVKLPSREIWLVAHRDLQSVARVRVVREFLASLFA
jgi:molybdate transport repressor ModE-like protein